MSTPVPVGVVWLLSDHKPGHQNQLCGLAERLQNYAQLHLEWIDCRQHPVSLRQLLRGQINLPIHLPYPNLILAAGSGTHRLLLLLKRQLDTFAAVLMKPGFPLRWIDAAIIPAHDRPPARPAVLATLGAPNRITPSQQPRLDHQGLILLGGPSRHYQWDDQTIIRQILVLCREQAGRHWMVANSRRTPGELFERLQQASQQAACRNITLMDQQALPGKDLEKALQQAAQVWVTPDSVAMIYESLTAGAPTGLLQLTPLHALPREGRYARYLPRKRSRVVQGVQQLLSRGWIQPFTGRAQLAGNPFSDEPLWEADRAARWLLARWRPELYRGLYQTIDQGSDHL